jgi:hypothetical protein
VASKSKNSTDSSVSSLSLESTSFVNVNVKRVLPYKMARTGTYEQKIGAEAGIREATDKKCIYVLLNSDIVAQTKANEELETAFELDISLEGVYSDGVTEATEDLINTDLVKKAINELYPLLIHQANISIQLMGYRGVLLKSGLDEESVNKMTEDAVK